MKKRSALLVLVTLMLIFPAVRGAQAEAAMEAAGTGAGYSQSRFLPDICRLISGQLWYDPDMISNLPDDFRDAMLDPSCLFTDGVYCYYFDGGSDYLYRSTLYKCLTNGEKLYMIDDDMRIQREYAAFDDGTAADFHGCDDWQLFYEVNNCDDYYYQMHEHYYKHLFLSPDGSFSYLGGLYESFAGKNRGKDELDILVRGRWNLNAENFTLTLVPDEFTQTYALHENEGLNDLFHLFTAKNGYACGCAMFDCEWVYANDAGTLMYLIDPASGEQMAFYCLAESGDSFRYVQLPG